MFTRIVFVPVQSLNKMIEKNESQDKINLARKINIKAIRKMRELRSQGNIFLMYPSATRYRPWKPETKRGIKEAAGYLNYFDHFCCLSINGNNMVPEKHEDMTGEKFVKDRIVFNFGEVQNTKEYIDKISKKGSPEIIDNKDKKKQYIVDNIVDDIMILHDKAGKYLDEKKVKLN
jgi:glycerol-3-phosphate O-acyltransferase